MEKYGQQFLSVIQRYCTENNLTSQMNEIVEKKRERKEKKPKGESNRITLEMYNAGKTIDEIVDEQMEDKNLKIEISNGGIFK